MGVSASNNSSPVTTSHLEQSLDAVCTDADASRNFLSTTLSSGEQYLDNLAKREDVQGLYNFLRESEILEDAGIRWRLRGYVGQALLLRELVNRGWEDPETQIIIYLVQYVFNFLLPQLKRAYPGISEAGALQVLDEFDFDITKIRDENVIPKPLSVWDFCPINGWEVYERSGSFNNGVRKWIRDSTTGNLYLNESSNSIRLKCFLLTLGSPILQGITHIIIIFKNMINIVRFHHFCKDDRSSFYSRCVETLKDLASMIFFSTFISLIFFELAALYGIFNPRDGRKLYASLERLVYGGASIAPCFGPLSTNHFFGGDIQAQDAF